MTIGNLKRRVNKVEKYRGKAANPDLDVINIITAIAQIRELGFKGTPAQIRKELPDLKVSDKLIKLILYMRKKNKVGANVG